MLRPMINWLGSRMTQSSSGSRTLLLSSHAYNLKILLVPSLAFSIPTALA